MKRVSALSMAILMFIVSFMVVGMSSSFAATTYSNYVVDQGGGDTYCLRSSDGNFYLYHPNGKRVYAHVSKDLVNWTALGEVYNIANVETVDDYDGFTVEHLWAPEVHEINGKYYMYYVSSMSGGADPDGTGNKDIWVVEGSSPTSFDKATRKKMLDGNYAFLDPTVFQDTDGSLYLFFKYRGLSGTGNEIKVRPLADPKTFGGDGKVLFRNTDMPASYGSGQTEHPHVEYKNGHYLLFFSFGDGDQIGPNGYKVVYAKATNPMGPYTLAGSNPIMYTGQNPGVYAPGATSGVRDGDDKMWIVYRQKKDSGDNRDLVTCIERLYISDLGNVTVEATRNIVKDAPVPLP